MRRVYQPRQAALVVLLAIGFASGCENRTATTRVDLIPEVAAVMPGRPFYVGIRMRLRRGWHTYWKNPGDSGLPPRVAWSLPPGFEAGPIEWPAPGRFAENGLMTYGYHENVVFPVLISPPAKIGADSVRIAATIDWLECKDVCEPGTVPVGLSLPVSPKQSRPGSGARAILAARARVPVLPKGWSMSAEAGPRAFALAFTPPEGVSPRAAYLYVDQPLVVEHAAPQEFERAGRGYRVTMTPAQNAIRNPARLTGVLLVEGSGLARPAAMRVDVPVTPGDPAPSDPIHRRKTP